ncbi:hypothetical protein RvY_06140 [Ramazzottius varieornatus]|uniref:non-specific serine/threonine protein kinase n=1 Tax=Ramazzottius varieornatus TaxID=947166 RepID=A0A1D1V0J4_RAMVA|nr:hypothetical protein RvY_06140 [Ramazzottius varieornatus]
MRDPVEDQSDETSKVQRETVGSASRPRSSRRSKSRPSDKGNPSKLPQSITQRIEEVPVVKNDQTVQRGSNGAVEGCTKDQQSHHVKHVKRKKDKAKTGVSDEEAPLDRMLNSAPEDENILPSSTPDNAVGKARRRHSLKARPKTAKNRKDEAEARGTTGGSPVVDNGILSHSPPGTSAATTETILLPLVKVDVANLTAGKEKKATATPNEQDEAESNEVGRRVDKPRRKSKAKTRASNSPNENVVNAEHIPLKSHVPVIEEPQEEEITDKARTTNRQRFRPGQMAGPTAVLVELTELPTKSSAVFPPDNPFEEAEETEQAERKVKKHEKEKHRKKTKDGTSEGGLHRAGSAEKTEHEPLKPPRPPLILSPSDAAVFQRPEPPPELGPTQKRPPTVHRKVPQTALLMGLTRKNKVTPSDPSTLKRSTSETSDEALLLPTAQPSGSAEELIDEETKSHDETNAVTAEDSTVSGHKSHKHKKDKKTRRHKSRSEIKKDKSPEKSLLKSEALTLPSVEAVEQRVEKDEPEADMAPLVTAENNEDEEDDHDSAQKKGKKKKKKKRDEDSGQMNAEDDNAAGKKRKKKKKPRDTTQDDSRGVANEAAKNMEPTESEAARLADELYGKAVGNFFILEDVLGKGGFGEARRGKHITTGKKYAIKLERTNDGNESLADEYKIYQILGNHNGFPKCYYFGVGPKNSNALVMDLLGPSLEDYFRAMDRQWSLKTVCLVALQILERIEYVHSKGFVYSDIKPENFLVGLPEEHQDSTVFLIDFGLAQQFKDKDTGKYCYDENLKTHPVGTMRYVVFAFANF